MKTNLVNWLSTLCTVLLVVLLVLQTKQKREIETLRQEHQAFVSATEQHQQEARDAVSKLANQLAAIGTSLESRLAQSEQQQKEQRAERGTNFREMHQQLNDLVNSGALFPDKSKPAAEAVGLALAAEKAGDTNLAEIYYLSAINHAPSEFSMLKGFAELVFHDSSAAPEDFDRLKSVLQISLYQIPPANITNALTLLNETVRRQDQLLATQTPRPVPVNWQEWFDQLVKSNTLENSWSNLTRISSRWDDLNEIVESLHEEQPASDLTKQVEQELEVTQRVLAAARLTTALDTIMKTLATSSNHPEMAVSLLQTAEETLGQVWGIDSTGWPGALLTKVKQYPNDIHSNVEIVAKVKSQPFLKTVQEARDAATNYVQKGHWQSVVAEGHPYQRTIRNCDTCYETAAAAAQNISSTECRTIAEAAMNEIRELEVNVRRLQFDDYQKWVIGLCTDTFQKYDDAHFMLDPTTRSSVKARQFFTESSFVEVDEALLAPETSHLFNDVLAKLINEMDGKMTFTCQHEMAHPEIVEKSKKKLEDF